MNDISIKIVRTIAIAILLGFGAGTASAYQALRLAVVPSCPPAASCTLAITLTNVSHNAITLYESFLPWRLNGMVLLVTENRPLGKMVNAFAAIDDPTGETITLDAGRSISGSVDLSSRFPDFTQARKDSDLLVFWSYEPKGPHTPARARLTGSAVISRSTQQPH